MQILLLRLGTKRQPRNMDYDKKTWQKEHITNTLKSEFIPDIISIS